MVFISAFDKNMSPIILMRNKKRKHKKVIFKFKIFVRNFYKTPTVIIEKQPSYKDQRDCKIVYSDL